jgi:hypothetical protein
MHNTTAPQDLNTYRPVLSHMHRAQLYLRIWTRIVLIISHTQNTTAPQDFNTYRSEFSNAQYTTAPQDLKRYRPVLSHMRRTQLHLRILTRIVLNSQMHSTQLHLRIWRGIVLYYLTCTEHNCTSGFEHVSSSLSHMHRTQLHLRFWTRIVLNYLKCTVHNCTSGYEHVSSWIILHAQYTTASRDLNTRRPELPNIPESNPHPNLIRTSFCRFLKRKKKVSSRF